MDMSGYVDEVKFKLTGGVLELEIDDSGIQKTIEHSLREMQRYLGNARYITLPFKSCIDVSEYHISDVRAVYAADANMGIAVMGDNGDGLYRNTLNSALDPAAWWMYYNGSSGQVSTLTKYIDNYYAYVQLRKSTNMGDLKRLSFNYNKADELLYINNNAGVNRITIEYVPRFDNVEEITNDAWIDILVRLSVANLKITLGRARSRFTQSNALWSQDGERLLEEGTKELEDLRTYLDASASTLRPR